MIQLRPVEGGTNACLYDFLPGWPHTTDPTVGKTPNAKGDWPSKSGSEAWILNEVRVSRLSLTVRLRYWFSLFCSLKIGELYAHAHDATDRDWIVMKKQPGQWLTRTPQYRFLATNRHTCHKFFQDAYTAVYWDAKNYIAQFGCVHAGNTEMNEANILFEFDVADNVRTPFLFSGSLTYTTYRTANCPPHRLGRCRLF